MNPYKVFALKALIFVAGMLVGIIILALLATFGGKAEEDKLSIMRICIKKQDDAIRKKQNRIDELEREARKEKRK